jgi:hypothetical protein
MTDEKREGILERNAHRVALGGQVAAVLSIIFLVPVIRRLRGQRRRRLHLPLFGS